MGMARDMRARRVLVELLLRVPEPRSGRAFGVSDAACQVRPGA